MPVVVTCVANELGAPLYTEVLSSNQNSVHTGLVTCPSEVTSLKASFLHGEPTDFGTDPRPITNDEVGLAPLTSEVSAP